MTTDSQGAPLHVTHIEIGKDRFQIQTDLTDAELSAIVDYVTNKNVPVLYVLNGKGEAAIPAQIFENRSF